MAVFITYSSDQQTIWDNWVASRPADVQAMCASHPANRIYKLKTTGQIVTLMSYFEDGTVSVYVDPICNRGRMFVGHGVFGITLSDLEETEVPAGVDINMINR